MQKLRSGSEPGRTSMNLDEPREPERTSRTSANVASASDLNKKEVSVSVDVSCPPDLDLLPGQKANLQMWGCPDWAISAMVSELRTTLLGKTSMKMSLDSWRSYVSRAIIGRWSDPAQRPKKPVHGERVLSWGPTE
jgi:hypothetical protein